ncbi:hypothetical protein FOG51_01830 [Hanseniaspora uvarum]|nr:hypothetical protein FOG48_00177 [Hanseniaspora uvarum]KAF0273328.1 hypothetical protein FOG51_01830 [Hanseniaspora uvarum]KAF0278271.1 hypothetical protein FOG50_00837 [Hanseniaspora uvarum]
MVKLATSLNKLSIIKLVKGAMKNAFSFLTLKPLYKTTKAATTQKYWIKKKYNPAKFLNSSNPQQHPAIREVASCIYFKASML